MKKLIASVVTIALLLTTLVGFAKDYPQKFYDVPKDHWAFEYIAELADRGAINGYEDGSFRPNGTVTRAEWAKIMMVSANRPLGGDNAAFADMNGHWANPYVNAAQDYMTAYEGGAAFRPDIAALREDVTVALVKLKGYNADNADFSYIAGFTDQDSISPSVKKYVAVAVEKGLINGFDDGTFRGQDTLTRAEAATLLWRAFQKGNDDKVVDGSGSPADSGNQSNNGTPSPGITPPPTNASTATPKPTTAPTVAPTATPKPTVAPTATPTATPAPTQTGESTDARESAPKGPKGDIIEGNKITGSLTYTGEKDTYTYTTDISGTYHFAKKYDKKIDVKVLRADGKELASSTGPWGGDFNVDLEVGKQYTIEVTTYDSISSINEYTITITVPDATVDVSGKTSFSASLTFTGEKDIYTYTAGISGTYHFAKKYDNKIDVTVKRADGKELGSSTGPWGGDFNIDLEAGKQYTIGVTTYDSISSLNEYTISITVPDATVDVSGRASFSGDLTFKGEKDIYTYTPTVSGKYHFAKKYDDKIDVTVNRADGKEMGSSTGPWGGDFNAELEAGQQYTIVVTTYDNISTIMNEYTITISTP